MIWYNKKINRVSIRSKYVISVHDVDDIMYIEAMGNYSKVILKEPEERIIIHCPMCTVENELNDGLFLRIHKSFIINILNIKGLRRGNPEMVILKNDQEIPVARRKKILLTKLLRKNL